MGKDRVGWAPSRYNLTGLTALLLCFSLWKIDNILIVFD